MSDTVPTLCLAHLHERSIPRRNNFSVISLKQLVVRFQLSKHLRQQTFHRTRFKDLCNTLNGANDKPMYIFTRSPGLNQWQATENHKAEVAHCDMLFIQNLNWTDHVLPQIIMGD
jgi:hypothetical protein